MKKFILLLSIYLFAACSYAQVKMYGLTTQGGANDQGVIFEWDPVTNIYTKKIDFDGSNGANPALGKLTANGGKFYGMTPNGGMNFVGVIFEWDPLTNSYTKKMDFDGIQGASPAGSLTFSSGKFYGMTQYGGTNNWGVIFEWDPVTNIYIKKHDLILTDGIHPSGNLISFNGKFYGMTQQYGGSFYGTIFEWDPATNICTKKIDFDGINGASPLGSLTLINDKFYGVTSSGGVNNGGVIFEWDPATNIYIKKINFEVTTTGALPVGSLSIFNNKLYGMAHAGTAGGGVIFEWDPSTNIYTKKINFADVVGSGPWGSLTINSNKFYGMTLSGGANSAGVIFKWDPVTNIYSNTVDFNGADGLGPQGDLAVLDNSILPIKLLSFSASLQNTNATRLQWQIAAAEADSKYELQRRSDGQSFYTINQQTGNSLATRFGYQDNNLPNGTYYYRLKMTDKAGTNTYSNVVIVKVGSKEKRVFAYPNPVKRGERLQINIQNIIANKIEIINEMGQVVYRSATRQTGNISLPLLSSLAPGEFVIIVHGETNVYRQKILIQ